MRDRVAKRVHTNIQVSVTNLCIHFIRVQNTTALIKQYFHNSWSRGLTDSLTPYTINYYLLVMVMVTLSLLLEKSVVPHIKLYTMYNHLHTANIQVLEVGTMMYLVIV